MPKLDCCDRCELCAHSVYLVCAVHPTGVEGDTCLDFRPAPVSALPLDDPLAWYEDAWQPVGASYYGGELILDPVQSLTLEQQLELLDSHPLFTGRCPECEMPIAAEERVHWDCGHCGWKDDSV